MLLIGIMLDSISVEGWGSRVTLINLTCIITTACKGNIFINNIKDNNAKWVHSQLLLHNFNNLIITSNLFPWMASWELQRGENSMEQDLGCMVCGQNSPSEFSDCFLCFQTYVWSCAVMLKVDFSNIFLIKLSWKFAARFYPSECTDLS